ncbi:MAG: hypothetical protein HQK84_04660 [Nitrospinae bacterium]|nr:hypothetical protein [Nitrospinota bacterium]
MKKIQGTDGVRGEVILSRNIAVRGKTPQEVFLESGKLTEHFFELYTYVVTKYFEEVGFLAKNKRVVIGWDPRDKSTIFTESAIRGLLKNDVELITLGVVPTPLVSFATTFLDAAFGIAITASHNPADQNGVKVFFGYSGLKPMEKDDLRISELFFEQSFSELSNIPIEGIRRNEEEAMKNIYVAFCCSFLKKQPEIVTRRLLVDNANGSNSILSKRVFSKQQGIEVIMVNTYQKGTINEKCGVTYFEGIKTITFDEIQNFTSNLAEVPILRRLIRESESIEKELLEGTKLISGIVFDGDGDRIAWIEVDVRNKLLHVLSGDEIAANLIKETSHGKTTLFINTIESDVNSRVHAESEGCTTGITPVGDKWLILELVKKNMKNLLGKYEKDRIYKGEVLKKIAHIDTAWELSLLYREVCLNCQVQLEKLGRFLVNRKFIGSEKSGHIIISRVLKTAEKKFIPIQTGNALEISAEFAKVTPFLLKKYGVEDYHHKLANPFEEGLKGTYYLYYTKRELFHSESAFFEEVKSKIPHMVLENTHGGTLAFCHPVENDPNVLFFEIKKEQEEAKMCIYIRNSGTEAKTGVSIRGDLKHEEFLKNMVTKIIEYLETFMRDTENPYFQLGISVLWAMWGKEYTNFDFLNNVETNLSIERLKKEFLFSEKNVQFQNGHLVVTPKGEYLLKKYLNRKKFEGL